MQTSDEVRVPKGTVLFRQGDPGDQLFVVAEGRVRLTLGSGPEAREIGQLGPGEFFGELSLLSGTARTATAQAIDDCRLLAIGRDAFAMMVQDDLEIVTRMLTAQGQRLSRTNRPIQRLGQTLARIRVIAGALRSMGPAVDLPWSVSLDSLATQLRATPEVVADILGELTASGAGVVREGVWRIDAREQVAHLLAALCAYAEEDSDATRALPVDPFSA
jgi:CRP/FNR family transcriptional regulator, cyclic AMP receptor protein